MIDILNEFEGGYTSDLDEGLEDPGVTHVSDAFGNVVKVGFNFMNGITPLQLGRVCHHYIYLCMHLMSRQNVFINKWRRDQIIIFQH